MIGIQERLQDAFQQFGWTRIPEILHHHAEEAATHNISYLEFLDILQDGEIPLRKFGLLVWWKNLDTKTIIVMAMLGTNSVRTFIN